MIFKIKLKKVKINDSQASKFLFTLRNKKYVRVNSINTKKIKFTEHKKWFEVFLKKKNIIYIIYVKKIMIGYIRLEKIQDIFYTSWAVLKKYQKLGFAKKSLKVATRNKNYKYKSLIKKNNLASISIAENASFEYKYKRKNILYYLK